MSWFFIIQVYGVRIWVDVNGTQYMYIYIYHHRVYSDVSMLVVAPSWLSWPLNILDHFTWSIGSLKPSGRANPLDPVWAQLGDRRSRCAGNNWLVETYITHGPGGLCKNPEAQLFFGGNEWCKWNIPFQDDLWLNGNGLGSPHYYICSCCFLGPPLSPLRWMSCFFKFFVWMAVFSNQGSLLRELDAGWWPWQVTRGVDGWGAGRVDLWDSEIGDCMLSYQAYRDIHLGHLLLMWPFYRGFDLWMNSKQGTPLRLSNLRLARLPSWPTKAPWIWFQGWRSWPATKREYSSPKLTATKNTIFFCKKGMCKVGKTATKVYSSAVYLYIPVVPHKAVAEVSRIGNV